jgi:hypothetical protein
MTSHNRACTLLIMCRKRILGVVVAAFVFLMAGALVYEALDIHDPKPFLIDPEFLLMMLSSVLIFCIGIAGLIRGVHSFSSSLAELLSIKIFGVWFSSTFQNESFEIELLLFSPPPSVTALRI